MQPGDKVLVFDSTAWREAGGDVGDNSCFYKEAIINEIDHLTETAAVTFTENGGFSLGHFLSGIRPIDT